jgi:tetratricopeptide (TPR) repeat protein
MGSRIASVLPSFKTMAIAGTAAFGAVAAGSLKLVNMASSLEESQSKVNVVFGEAAGVVNEFAATSAQAFGITKQAALEATGTFGNLLQAFGTGKGQAAEMSTTLIGLAADLASFNNTGIEDAIQALRSGLSGETEPLKRFGVALNDVRLKQEATTLGLYDGKGALDINAKTQAAYALILKDTGLAQGDFARTSDGFANQMRILKASLSDAATELGVVLLPYFKQFIIYVNQNIIPGVLLFAKTIGKEGLVSALAVAAAAMGDFGTSAIDTLENMYVGMLQFTAGVAKTVRILADGIALGAAVSKNPLLAAQALAAAIAASNIQEAAEESIEGAGAMFDRFRIKVGNAALALNAFKNINPVVDSFDKVGNKVLKVVVPAMTEAEKAAAALAAGLGSGTGSGGVAKAVKTATEKLKIYTDALKSSNSAQKSFTSAQKASVKAGQSLTAANQGVVDAQTALDQAVAGFGADSPQARKAAKELELAQRGLERAGYNVEGSLFAIKDAEEALKKVRADPESTPQAIREAEIALAEAKLSSADAIDQQTEATNSLTTATGLLNEAIFGASASSDIFKELSDALTDAKNAQADATDAVAEAIERETEALDNYREAIKKVGETQLLYPKVIAANPMAGVAAAIPATVTGNSTGFNANGSPINVTVNAGMISDEATLVSDLNDMFTEFARRNGNQFAGFVGVR